MGKLKFWTTIIKIAIITVAIASIIVFILNTDYVTLINQIDQVGFKLVYILVLTFIAYLLATMAWWVCMGSKKQNITLFQLFSIRQIGETLSLFNPASIVAGDLLKAKLLKPYHIDADTALKSVSTARITATLSQLALFTLAMLWLLYPENDNIQSPELRQLVVISIGILLLAKVSLLIWLAQPLKPGFTPTLKDVTILKRFAFTAHAITHHIKVCYQFEKNIFWTSYFLSALHWIIGSMEFYLLLSFVEYPIEIMHGLVLDMSVIVIKSLGAAIPGQLGIEELANKVMLAMIGIKGASIWIAISILRRLRQLIWIAIGILLTIFLKKEIKYATVL